MKVYIYDDYLEKTEKLLEASRGNAFHLAKLYVDHFNSVARSAKMQIQQEEEPGVMFIYVKDRHPRPIGH